MGGSGAFDVPLLWTTIDDGLDGLVLRVRGELSSATAPALDALLRSLDGTQERLGTLDLREVQVVEPAAERLLQRWPTEPGDDPDTYRFQPAGAARPG